MDKFVIGRVEAAIDYASIQFSIRFAVANRIDDAAKLVLNAVFSLQHSLILRMHLSTRRVQLDVRIGSRKITPACITSAASLPSEEGLVPPIDTKVSIGAIVQ